MTQRLIGYFRVLPGEWLEFESGIRRTYRDGCALGKMDFIIQISDSVLQTESRYAAPEFDQLYEAVTCGLLRKSSFACNQAATRMDIALTKAPKSDGSYARGFLAAAPAGQSWA